MDGFLGLGEICGMDVAFILIIMAIISIVICLLVVKNIRKKKARKEPQKDSQSVELSTLQLDTQYPDIHPHPPQSQQPQYNVAQQFEYERSYSQDQSYLSHQDNQRRDYQQENIVDPSNCPKCGYPLQYDSGTGSYVCECDNSQELFSQAKLSQMSVASINDKQKPTVVLSPGKSKKSEPKRPPSWHR